jgi:signal transduction histidine kinase
MSRPRKHARSERERTDRSLNDERQKTDDELTKRVAGLEERADDDVLETRKRADEVLARARTRADQKLATTEADSEELGVVRDERRREDDILRAERGLADEHLSGERDAVRRALTALLSLERERTDQHLLMERERNDEMIGSRDDFLAIVSHDVRNLLGAVALSAGGLYCLEANDEIRNAIQREARHIQRCTARMNRLVGDLLDLVSIEAGRLAMAPERHDAMDLLRETLDAFRAVASANKISLVSDVRVGCLFARYDHDRILQVLANLIGNAIKFTKKGGKIEIIVEAIGDEVRFAISDTGRGIDADKLSVIFERFWHVPEERRSGLGLGLYISKCIVEAHGGRIWAESRGAGGSTFYFTLPSATTPEVTKS